ncbi:MAG TPA: flagellar hook capping FlgD N-terminal domain-containing protein [Sphingobium sp.]|nr:flagellar hook capping FlgD N-terminal domain-containing protein [Sphingobium sp.]
MTTTSTTAPLGSTANLAQKSTGLTQKGMGQTDFLTLLTTQLKSQDPFNPLDNADLVAQMATISNTSGIAEMNQSLANIAQSLAGNRLGDAASWIGRSMLVTSNIAAPNAQGEYAGQITLPGPANGVSIDLIDGSGATVKTIDLGGSQGGDLSFYWDGRDNAGTYVGGQPLKVNVRGAAPTNVATWASVAAVQSPADGTQARLITPLGSFAPADAIKLT